MLGLRKGDLSAVRLPPGPRWADILAEARGAEAAILPLDHRLPEAEARRLVQAARPTAALDDAGLVRLDDGVPVDPGVTLVVATSGTTGRPRAVELTGDAVDAAVRASLARLRATDADEWLCPLPVAHMGGLLVVLRAAALGAPLRFAARLDDGRGYAAVVPTQLHRAIEARASLGGYRAILVGGAATGEALRTRAIEAGARTVTTYGMTESCGGVVYDGTPLDGVEIRVAADAEIQLRAPTVMRGYRLDDAATADAFTADGWLRTRDAGEVVAGRLVVRGRLDEVIVTGGEKVWPEEVEDALRAHPAIGDAAVVGRPDEEWGARVVALVVPADPATPPSLEDVRDHVAARLPRYKAPRDLVLVEELPRSPSGKLARSALPDAAADGPGRGRIG